MGFGDNIRMMGMTGMIGTHGDNVDNMGDDVWDDGGWVRGQWVTTWGQQND